MLEELRYSCQARRTTSRSIKMKSRTSHEKPIRLRNTLLMKRWARSATHCFLFSCQKGSTMGTFSVPASLSTDRAGKYHELLGIACSFRQNHSPEDNRTFVDQASDRSGLIVMYSSSTAKMFESSLSFSSLLGKLSALSNASSRILRSV
jgi:hypothetical protein